jgi:hypothetical protein
MPRENPTGNLPFELRIDVRPRGWVRDGISGFRHIKSQNLRPNTRLAYTSQGGLMTEDIIGDRSLSAHYNG